MIDLKKLNLVEEQVHKATDHFSGSVYARMYRNPEGNTFLAYELGPVINPAVLDDFHNNSQEATKAFAERMQPTLNNINEDHRLEFQGLSDLPNGGVGIIYKHVSPNPGPEIIENLKSDYLY